MTVWTAIVTSQVFAITLRILLSIGLGALIGLERQLRARSAGIRTNALVSLGSCLFTTVGVYTLAAGTGDPTRVAAQVASGIGFLGAGAILRSRDGSRVEGLTTAASIWMTAAIGMAVGIGQAMLALVATLFAWLVVAAMPGLVGRTAAHRGEEGGKPPA